MEIEVDVGPLTPNMMVGMDSHTITVRVTYSNVLLGELRDDADIDTVCRASCGQVGEVLAESLRSYISAR